MTVVLMLISFPREFRFQYEYQKNQPWKHGKLYAPFDFGVLKPEKILEEERARIKATQVPVFVYDESVFEKQVVKFDQEFESFQALFDDSTQCVQARDTGLAFLNKVYLLGILEQHEVLGGLAPNDDIQTLRGEVMGEVTISKVFSINTAYDTLEKFIAGLELDSACKVGLSDLITISLMPNLRYDKELTAKLLETRLSEIVLVSGKVNRGQTIVDRGDIVNESLYQVLQSLKKEYEKRGLGSTEFRLILLGQALLCISLLFILYMYLRIHRQNIFNDPRQFTFIFALTAFIVALAGLTIRLEGISFYAIPFCLIALLMRMFFDHRVTLYSFFVSISLCALLAPNGLEFLLVQFITGSLAVFYQASSFKRSKMLGTAALIFVSYSAVYLAFNLVQEGNLSTIYWNTLIWFAISAFLSMLAYPLMILVEKGFGFISDITLLELSDSNQPLLRELATKAPGTFQHSVQVANLAEKAAQEIGGNAVLVRTGALYHDIGKMNEPHFFIENQVPDSNPHDDFEPEESAQIIKDHVIKGIEMARAKDLPNDIIQFIRTHHGTSLIRYFFIRYKEKHPDEEVDEGRFRYRGPKPFSKETAIVMMADSVEAASRSLSVYTVESISNLVENIIDDKLADGQFEHSPITFAEIYKLKDMFKRSLRSIYHNRIKYE